MNRYDTLKIGFPAELIGFDSLTSKELIRLFSKNDKEPRNSDGETTVRERSTHYALRLQIAKPIRGLTGIEVITAPNRNSKAVIEFSSKSLGKDYFDGITKDNITTALQNLLPLGIECNCDKVVEGATVFRCDAVMNIPTASVERSVLALATHPVHDNMSRDNFTRGRANGIAIVSKTKSGNGLRLTAYDKPAEIARSRNRESLYRELGIERFANTIRIEAQYRNLLMIRNGHGLLKGTHPYLSDILSSSNNSVLYAMDNFYKPTSIADDYSPTPEGRASVIEEGYLAIFKRCNWDWSLCWAWVLSGYGEGTNPTREKKYVRELFNRMNPNANRQTVTEYQRLRDEVTRGQGM